MTIIKGLDYHPGEPDWKSPGPSLPSFYDGEQKVSQGKVFLVGDAAHLMDPLTGRGDLLCHSKWNAGCGGHCPIKGKWKGCLPPIIRERSRNSFLRNLKWALNVSRFVFRFTKLAYRTLKHYPELGNFYLQVLEGKETYQGFVTRVKDRARDLLKGSLSEKIKRVLAKP